MPEKNAELYMSTEETSADECTVTINIVYRQFKWAKLGQLETQYFTFFAGLPDAMRVPLPARRVEDQDAA